MVNIRVAAIIAGGAFVLSLVLCLISGNRFPDFIIKPFIFALLFFGIGAGGTYLLSSMSVETNANTDFTGPLDNATGGNINISVGDDGNAGSFDIGNFKGVDEVNGIDYNSGELDDVENNGPELSDDGSHYLSKVSYDTDSPIKGPEDSKKAALSIQEMLRRDND